MVLETYALLLNGLRTGVLALNLETEQIFVNESAARMLNYQNHSSRLQNLSDFLSEFPTEYKEWLSSFISGRITQGDLVINEEYHLLFSKKTQEDLLVIEITESTSIDIALQQINQLSGEYQQLTDLIKQVQKDFQDYTYIVSHDLKGPIRGIDALISFIMEDLDELSFEFPEKIIKQFNLLKKSSYRLEKMMDDLTLYSRAGTESDREWIPMSSLLDEHVKRYASDSIQINIKDIDLEIYGGIGSMKVLFKQLFENAIIHNPKPNKTIDFHAKESTHHYSFFIRDNGEGIEEGSFEKIFKPFSTLKAQDKIMHSGIGLSAVKKIMDKHHGSIHVRSQVGEFTEFEIRFLKSDIRPK